MAHEDESAAPAPPEERFEIIELDCTPFLTDEEKSWPVVSLEQREHFEPAELEEIPSLELTLFLAANAAPDSQEMVKELAAVLEMVNTRDTANGGGGYTLGDRWTEPGKLVITLLPVKVDGAAARLDSLVRWLNEVHAAPGVTRIAARAA